MGERVVTRGLFQVVVLQSRQGEILHSLILEKLGWLKTTPEQINTQDFSLV
jgi:hypothetical protein